MSVDFHKHCQATVLSAYGPSGHGATWDYIRSLGTIDLPDGWINQFTSNTENITEDFVSILNIIAAVNTSAVHKTGNETIGGNKTFSNKIHISSTGDASSNQPNPPLMIGSKTSYHLEIDNNEILARTGNGQTSETFGKTHDDTGTYASLGRHLGDLTLQGKNIYLNAWGLDPNTGTLTNGEYPKNGNVFLQHSPSSGATGRQVVDAAWVIAKGYLTSDATFVHKTGNETITGTKTFDGSGSVVIQKSSGFNYSGIEAGTTNTSRNVWFSHTDKKGTPVYDEDFKYNPYTNTLSVDTIDTDKITRGVELTESPDPGAIGHQIVDAAWVRSVIQTNNESVVTQYVSSSGDDGNDGRAATTAKKTISKAMQVLNGYRLSSATGLDIGLYISGKYDLNGTGIEVYNPTIAHPDAVNQNYMLIAGQAPTYDANGKIQFRSSLETSSDINSAEWYQFINPIVSNLRVSAIKLSGWKKKDTVTNSTLVAMAPGMVSNSFTNVAVCKGFTTMFNTTVVPGALNLNKYVAFSGVSLNYNIPYVRFWSSRGTQIDIRGQTDAQIRTAIDALSGDQVPKLILKDIRNCEWDIMFHKGSPYHDMAIRCDIVLDNVTCKISSDALGYKYGKGIAGVNGSEYYYNIYCLHETNFKTVFPNADESKYNVVSTDAPSWYDQNWDSI